MGERSQDKRLAELKANGITVYSISRLDAINNCLYGAYKTYILKEGGANNCYATLGGCIHDVLEGIVDGEKSESDLLPAMNKDLESLDILGIDFPSDAIRDSWVTDMTHFCETYKSPRGENLHTEEIFFYQTPKGRWLHGYIDLYRDNGNGTINIYDYKTSTLYTGEELKKHARQLIIYALGKEQEGLKVNSASWIFLKYVAVEFMGYATSKSKNKTLITKVIERKKIASEMLKHVERDMIESGVDESVIDLYIEEFKRTNRFESLPKEVRDHYVMKPYVLNADLSDEAKQECIDYIDSTVDKWESLDASSDKDFLCRSFTKKQKNGKVVDDTFFCSFLCDHKKSCKYLTDYYNKKDEGEDDDLFG